MFKPNRVGTPNFWTLRDATVKTDAPVNFAESNFVAQDATGNCINATPLSDYGTANLMYDIIGETVAANQKIMILAQFEVTPPQQGTIVGVELQGSMVMATVGAVRMAPIFAQAQPDQVLTGVLDTIDLTYIPMLLSNEAGHLEVGALDTKIRHFKTQVVMEYADPSGPSIGPYVFGWAFYNATGGAVPIYGFETHLSIRQLNDQQFIGYRDTLR